MMFTTVRGRFKQVAGRIVVDDDNPDNSSVEVTIDAASMDTGVADRDAHLRSADFLDVGNHPSIEFRSRKVEGAYEKPGDTFKVHGDLTIRGKTLPVTLDASFEGRGKDPWGKDRAGFSASTEIDRRDWGLVWNQALESGGILVGHNVRIEMELQVVKQDDRAASASFHCPNRRPVLHCPATDRPTPTVTRKST